MRRMIHLALMDVTLIVNGPVTLAHHGAATDPKPPVFRLEKVSERVWCLFGRGGNVGIYGTGAGVVVVDDQYADLAEGIVDQIRTLTS